MFPAEFFRWQFDWNVRRKTRRQIRRDFDEIITGDQVYHAAQDEEVRYVAAALLNDQVAYDATQIEFLAETLVRAGQRYGFDPHDADSMDLVLHLAHQAIAPPVLEQPDGHELS